MRVTLQDLIKSAIADGRERAAEAVEAGSTGFSKEASSGKQPEGGDLASEASKLADEIEDIFGRFEVKEKVSSKTNVPTPKKEAPPAKPPMREPAVDVMKAAAKKEAILRKLGMSFTPGGDGKPAKPNGTPAEGPGHAAGEEHPKQPPAAGLVATNEKAMSYTKGDAKAFVKKELAALFKNPPLSKAKDPVLHQNLRNAQKAGVKIAGAKSGKSDLQKLTEAVKAKVAAAGKAKAQGEGPQAKT